MFVFKGRKLPNVWLCVIPDVVNVDDPCRWCNGDAWVEVVRFVPRAGEAEAGEGDSEKYSAKTPPSLPTRLKSKKPPVVAKRLELLPDECKTLPPCVGSEVLSNASESPTRESITGRDDFESWTRRVELEPEAEVREEEEEAEGFTASDIGVELLESYLGRLVISSDMAMAMKIKGDDDGRIFVQSPPVASELIA